MPLVGADSHRQTDVCQSDDEGPAVRRRLVVVVQRTCLPALAVATDTRPPSARLIMRESSNRDSSEVAARYTAYLSLSWTPGDVARLEHIIVTSQSDNNVLKNTHLRLNFIRSVLLKICSTPA